MDTICICFLCWVTNYHKFSHLKHIYYLTVYIGQKSGRSLAGFSARVSTVHDPGIHRGVVSSETQLGKRPRVIGKIHLLVVTGLKSLFLLLAASQGPLLVPRDRPAGLTTAAYFFQVKNRVSDSREGPVPLLRAFTWLNQACPRSSPFWVTQNQLIWDLNFAKSLHFAIFSGQKQITVPPTREGMITQVVNITGTLGTVCHTIIIQIV